MSKPTKASLKKLKHGTKAYYKALNAVYGGKKRKTKSKAKRSTKRRVGGLAPFIAEAKRIKRASKGKAKFSVYKKAMKALAR
jgi:hypothetical protein